MELSDILNLVWMLGGIGLIVYLFNLLKIDPAFKHVFNTIVLFVLVIWAIYWVIRHLHPLT